MNTSLDEISMNFPDYVSQYFRNCFSKNKNSICSFYNKLDFNRPQREQTFLSTHSQLCHTANLCIKLNYVSQHRFSKFSGVKRTHLKSVGIIRLSVNEWVDQIF